VFSMGDLSVIVASATLVLTPAAAAQGPKPSRTAATIERLEQSLERAQYAKDRRALVALFASDFEGRFPGGVVLNRDSAIAALMRPERAGSTSSHEGLSVRVFGPTAVAQGRCRTTMNAQDEVMSFVNVWILRSGRWQLASITMMAPESLGGPTKGS
jgi:Domain of unknown function (DUF4440)